MASNMVENSSLIFYLIKLKFFENKYISKKYSEGKEIIFEVNYRLFHNLKFSNLFHLIKYEKYRYNALNLILKY